MVIPEFVETLLASGVGAALAALLGFRFALARFRREKGVQVRVDWYKKAIAQLQASSMHLVVLGRPQDVLPSSGRNIEGAVERLLNLIQLRSEAELYATTSSYRALGQVADAVQDVLLVTSEEYLDTESERHQELLDTLAAAAYAMGEAASQLIDDVRDELGLSRLKRGWTWRKDRSKSRHESIYSLIKARDPEIVTHLDVGLIERMLVRSHQHMFPEEREQLAADLESYAAELRAAGDIEAEDQAVRTHAR